MNHSARKEAAFCLLKQIGTWLALVFLLFIVVVFFWVPLPAQERSNTFYAAQFDGSDVGTKIMNAQMACNTNFTCVIVIDAVLTQWPQGTIPAHCTTCVWMDYRGGAAGASSSIFALRSTDSISWNGDSAISRNAINALQVGSTGGTPDASGDFEATIFGVQSGGVIGFRRSSLPRLVVAGLSSANAGEIDVGNGTAGDASGTVKSAKMILNTETISSSPRMIWTLTSFGNPNNLSLMGTLTFDKAISITRISARSFGATLGACTAFPTFTVSDGTNTCTMTWVNASVVDAVPTGQCSFAGAASLNADTNAGTGCSGTPSQAMFFVQYKMQ